MKDKRILYFGFAIVAIYSYMTYTKYQKFKNSIYNV